MNKRLLVLITILSGALLSLLVLFVVIFSNLPRIVDKEDYKPLLASTLYDRHGQVLGKLFRERRSLIPFEQIPKRIIKAFISAEDASFFEHSGINYLAIIRAFIANMRAGKLVQGGSTITQQLAKTLLLSPEKTYIRKLKEALLAYHMESALNKETILFLYLNQIYFGSGAYGIVEAAQTYFRKKVKELTLAEIALLAGLPKAPSRFSPLRNPLESKLRQNYVLERMYETNDITEKEKSQAKLEQIKIYLRESNAHKAPFFIETIRQQLISEIGEPKVLEGGLHIYTGLDLKLQTEAQKFLRYGLRQIDKRQGYRGPLANLNLEEEEEKEDKTKEEKRKDFLIKTKQDFIRENANHMWIHANGNVQYDLTLNTAHKLQEKQENKNQFIHVDKVDQEANGIPFYLKKGDSLKGIVTHVSDKWGLVTVQIPDGLGLIDVSSMKWATPFSTNKKKRKEKKVEKPSEVLKVGDVIKVIVDGTKFYSQRINKLLAQKYKGEKPEDLPDFENHGALRLEQEPIVEGALLSFDQKTEEIIAMVGGYDFKRSQFNRTFQAIRQTGSAFKAIVYAAAIEKGYNAVTPIIDAPVVFEEALNDEEDNPTLHRWRPTNYSKRFKGEVFFRDALIQSLNVPTIKIATDIGLKWIAVHAKKLGIFHPLNMDLTLSLGSSGTTLYEMTKVFSQFGRMGKRIRPLLIQKVTKQEIPFHLSQQLQPSQHSKHRQYNSNSQQTGIENEIVSLVENLSLDKRFALEIEKIEQEILKKQESQKTESTEAQDKDFEVTDLTKKTTQKSTELIKQTEQKDQLLKSTTAFLITNLLESVVTDPYGTGGGARVLNRPVAGKTGTTNSYHDAWFIGYTPQIATGVWVGFDAEKSLGHGETGGRSALPIWINYMFKAHQNLPKVSFHVPDKIIFANIDKDTGKLASLHTKKIIRQAFLEGTEPKTDTFEKANDSSFYRQDYDD